MADRIIDSPDLFGSGIGSGTYAEIKCEMCGTVYSEGCGADEDESTLSDESVSYTNFAGLVVAECCFGRIEREVLHRSDDVIKWLARIFEARRERADRSLQAVRDAVAEEPRDG